MAQRLSSEERARVEAMTAAGVGVKETARRLGRHRSTVYRELARTCGSGGYDAQAAQTAADGRARRPKTPVLAADPVLAAAALSRLTGRRSPHAASAELRVEGLSVSAETIYRACYDPTGRRGLPEGCWRLLPRRCRRRKPRGRHTRKPSPLGDFRPIADRPAAAAGRTAATSDGAKTDALDARRAAREVLGRPDLAVPRARGRREALRALESTRRGAQTARTAAINELKALIVSAPVDLRDQLRGLTTAAQVAKCAAFRLPAAPLDELTATKQALRSLARRIKTLTAEAADLQTSIRWLVEAVAPHLLDQPGVGPVTAAQIYIAWSHPGRCRNEAAFARLAGVAPLEASSGQNTRHRLNRRGDRQLNRALHTIAVTRSRYCPHTQAHIAKPTAEGKTPREAQRCLKRYIARQIYRLLQHPKINT